MLLFGGQVRLRHLYTDDGQDTEAHVELGPDGAVRAVAERSPNSECGMGLRAGEGEAVCLSLRASRGCWAGPLTAPSPQVFWN